MQIITLVWHGKIYPVLKLIRAAPHEITPHDVLAHNNCSTWLIFMILLNSDNSIHWLDGPLTLFDSHTKLSEIQFKILYAKWARHCSP